MYDSLLFGPDESKPKKRKRDFETIYTKRKQLITRKSPNQKALKKSLSRKSMSKGKSSSIGKKPNISKNSTPINTNAKMFFGHNSKEMIFSGSLAKSKSIDDIFNSLRSRYSLKRNNSSKRRNEAETKVSSKSKEENGNKIPMKCKFVSKLS